MTTHPTAPSIPARIPAAGVPWTRRAGPASLALLFLAFAVPSAAVLAGGDLTSAPLLVASGLFLAGAVGVAAAVLVRGGPQATGRSFAATTVIVAGLSVGVVTAWGVAWKRIVDETPPQKGGARNPGADPAPPQETLAGLERRIASAESLFVKARVERGGETVYLVLVYTAKDNRMRFQRITRAGKLERDVHCEGGRFRDGGDAPADLRPRLAVALVHIGLGEAMDLEIPVSDVSVKMNRNDRGGNPNEVNSNFSLIGGQGRAYTAKLFLQNGLPGERKLMVYPARSQLTEKYERFEVNSPIDPAEFTR